MWEEEIPSGLGTKEFVLGFFEWFRDLFWVFGGFGVLVAVVVCLILGLGFFLGGIFLTLEFGILSWFVCRFNWEIWDTHLQLVEFLEVFGVFIGIFRELSGSFCGVFSERLVVLFLGVFVCWVSYWEEVFLVVKL
jgi:hypothetical protein